MTDAPHLLIAWHSRTGGSEALADAAARGATTARLIAADAVTPADLHAAAGYLFVGPENLAALSGAMKEMFDRCYYPCLGRLEGGRVRQGGVISAVAVGHRQAALAVMCRG